MGIETDAGDMKTAWNGINQKIGETPPALGQIPPKVKEVKDAIDSLQPPDLGGPAELQPLIQNLDYYRTKLKMAEDAQREASVAAREAERVYLDISNQLKAGTASQDNFFGDLGNLGIKQIGFGAADLVGVALDPGQFQGRGGALHIQIRFLLAQLGGALGGGDGAFLLDDVFFQRLVVAVLRLISGLLGGGDFVIGR